MTKDSRVIYDLGAGRFLFGVLESLDCGWTHEGKRVVCRMSNLGCDKAFGFGLVTRRYIFGFYWRRA